MNMSADENGAAGSQPADGQPDLLVGVVDYDLVVDP